MVDTPRTDAVLEAAKALSCGSIVQIPEGHPPCDPWELARELERQLAEAQAELLYIMELYDSEVWNCERCGHAEETKTMNGAYDLREWLTSRGLYEAKEPK